MNLSMLLSQDNNWNYKPPFDPRDSFSSISSYETSSDKRTSSGSSFEFDANEVFPRHGPRKQNTLTFEKGKTPIKKRRTKTFRACRSCQIAHLTCDDGRPCKSCVRRGLHDTCISGTHKKAKYLQDIPDEVLAVGLRSSKNPGNDSETLVASEKMSTQLKDLVFLDPARTPLPGSTFKTLPEDTFSWLKDYMKSSFSSSDSQRVHRQISVLELYLQNLRSSIDSEDFDFSEVCLRRSFQEYKKLISMSGTPSIVVRRTGEICVVEESFLKLTGWMEEELAEIGKHIFEIITPASTIDYFDSLLESAIGNGNSRISNCVLLTRTRTPINCKWVLTIKDDIFNIPSLIIAQFLPIVSQQ